MMAHEAPVIAESSVKELVSGKKVLVHVSTNTPLLEALQILKVHGITAMPVTPDPSKSRSSSFPQVSTKSTGSSFEELHDEHHKTTTDETTTRSSTIPRDHDNSSGSISMKVEQPSTVWQRSEALQAAAAVSTGHLEALKLVSPSRIQFVGMISLVDIALYLSRFDPLNTDKKGFPKKEAGNAQVADAMGASEETRHLLVLDPHATLKQAMEFLGCRGFHRALVPNLCLYDHGGDSLPMAMRIKSTVGGDNVGEEYRLLSQSDIIRFLIQHEGRLGLSLAQSVDDLGLVWPSVVSTSTSTPVLHALSLLRTYGVTALAVTDGKEDGKGMLGKAILVDTLSASDMRFCDESLLSELSELSVTQFLEKVRGAGRPAKAVTCNRTTSLRNVLTTLVANHVHRVWVTEEDEEHAHFLQGVITLSDIIRVMSMMPVTNPWSEDEPLLKVEELGECLKKTEISAAESEPSETPPGKEFTEVIKTLDQSDIDSWSWLSWWPITFTEILD